VTTSLNLRAFRQSVFGTVVMAGLLFIPAGTLDYWQAWTFMAIFVSASTAITVYLAINAPSLLERRMRVGPAAETEPTQKIAVSFALAGFIALLVVSALDHRFGWSRVPASICLIGDALIVLGFVFVWLVLKENPFGASTVQISDGQRVITTGPYALVRHPMYAGALALVVGTPLALGSWWGLLGIVLLFPALVWRLLDEETFLKRNLPGYEQYAERVRYRLVPLIW
jgi:protein-S-isoprenylcysteine O-methyltransferase Ste14